MTCNTGNPITLFGVHSLAFYDRCTREHYGIVKVLSGASLALSGETIALTAGSNRYPWAIEDGLITAEMSATFAEYPPFLDEVLLGKQATAISAEATGAVSGFANANGESIFDLTNGMDAVEVTSGDSADLKFAKYVIVATGAATFDVYASSDVDFGRGTNFSYLGDSNLGLTKVVEGGDISLGDHVEADLGLTFSSVGTPAFTVGDTAVFEVRPPHNGAYETVIGGISDVYPEFGCIVYAQKSASGQLFELDLFRCKAIGLPFNFSANEFSEAEVTIQAFYDSNRNGVFSKRIIL